MMSKENSDKSKVNQILPKVWRLMENKCSVKEGAEKKFKRLIILEEWGKQGWFPAPEEPFFK